MELYSIYISPLSNFGFYSSPLHFHFYCWSIAFPFQFLLKYYYFVYFLPSYSFSPQLVFSAHQLSVWSFIFLYVQVIPSQFLVLHTLFLCHYPTSRPLRTQAHHHHHVALFLHLTVSLSHSFSSFSFIPCLLVVFWLSLPPNFILFTD